MSIKFTCEVGSNHNSSIERAKALIDSAKDAGFDAVKFQALPPTPSGLWRDGRDVPWAWLSSAVLDGLSDYARARGLEFHCSVFNIEDVDWLSSLVDSFKIGSYEILCHDMIRACAETGKPLALSFGNYMEDEAYAAIRATRPCEDLTLYHCVSDYPTKLENCNMQEVANSYAFLGAKRGWSDHTRNPLAIFAAIGCGATAVEMHLDLDGEGAEFSHGHVWLPEESRRVIKAAREMETCMNGNSEPDAERLAMRTDPKDYKRGLIK